MCIVSAQSSGGGPGSVAGASGVDSHATPMTSGGVPSTTTHPSTSAPRAPALTECTPEAVASFLEVVQREPCPDAASCKASLASLLLQVPFDGPHDEEEDTRRCTTLAPCLPWVASALHTHVGDVGVVGDGLALLRRVAWASKDKVVLMVYVPLTVACLRAHALGPVVAVSMEGDGDGGDRARVALQGLAFLRMLAFEDANEVRAHVCVVVRGSLCGNNSKDVVCT